MRICIIDKAPSRNKYSDYFKFDLEIFHMSSVPVPKLLKRDVDLVIDLDEYDFVILVGSEAAKEYAKISSVTNYAGQLMLDKFICISNPGILHFKPEGKEAFKRAVDRIHKYVSGDIKPVKDSGEYLGIANSDKALKFLKEVLANAEGYVTWDTETTCLYPRDGYVLGLSMSYKSKHGAYISTDCLDEECMEVLRDIISTHSAVFHNMKFDIKMIEYHLGLKFDRSKVHDTMCMHYVLDENESHGLKALALKYTDYGDYDAELDDFKKSYCAKTGLSTDSFTYDLIPFDIISKYACLTHDSLVFMADGTKKTIGELVRSKSTDKVLSYNETTGIYEANSISGWIKQSHKTKEWYSLVIGMYTTETVLGSGIYKGPKFTADHKVLLNTGWAEVSNVVPGDRILSRELDLSTDSYQILYGSLLGDGRFDSRNSSGAGIMVSQAASHKLYAEFKAQALNCSRLKIVTASSQGKKQDMYEYSSEYSLLYTDLFRSTTFREGTSRQKPEITVDFCNNLTLKALAIWYMDDGNLAEHTPRIWSRSSSSNERTLMLKCMEDLGLTGARFFEDASKNNQFFVWSTEFQDNFFSLLAPYMHPDCAYKIPEKYVHLVGTYFWETTSKDLYYSIIYSKVQWNPPVTKRGYSTKWCINVENNHNFFTDAGLVHNCIDTAVTFDLFHKFWPIIQKNAKILNVYNTLMIPGTLFLMDMEEVGIPISRERMTQAETYLDKWILEAKEEIYTFDAVKQFEADAGIIFNPNSVQQLRKVLFDYVKLSPVQGKLTATGAISTDAEVLKELSEQHPLPAAILKVRQLGKIKSTYISKILPELDKDGRIRTNFNLIFTTSGRLSSSGKFNAQQIPRDNPIIKGCIVAPEGYKIVNQDLKTGEVYYAAVLSGDKNLQKVFTTGGDFHSTIAKSVFDLDCAVEDVKELFGDSRQAAKAITFSILYGAGPTKVAATVTKETGEYYSLDRAKEDISSYYAKFNKLKSWLKSRKEFIEANGYTYSFTGRKRRLINVFSSDKGIAAHEVRSGINSEVQSLCSDINLLAAIDTANELVAKKLDAKIFALIHDSIVAIAKDEDVAEYCEIVKRNTQKDRGCSIPGSPIGVDQDVGQDYAFGDFQDYYKLENGTLSLAEKDEDA